MTKAPSIKEALEYVLQADFKYGANRKIAKDLARRALATFQPDGERREAIAREPFAWAYRSIFNEHSWTLLKAEPHFDNDQYIKKPLYLASGLVQDEAGWRDISTAPKDMTEIIVLCGPKDVRLGWYFAPSSTTFGWRDQRQKLINPTHWMPLPAPPIRSARDGGAAT